MISQLHQHLSAKLQQPHAQRDKDNCFPLTPPPQALQSMFRDAGIALPQEVSVWGRPTKGVCKGVRLVFKHTSGARAEAVVETLMPWREPLRDAAARIGALAPQ